MIQIQQHDSDAAPPDPQALALFQRQWTLYRKVVDHNYLHHRETGMALREALLARPPGPLRLIDLACGDAGTTRRVLLDVPISHYRGIDLSRPALELAAVTLADIDGEVVLEQRDFSTALADCPASADVIWIGLSLHHLDTAGKLKLLRDARQALDHGGELLMFEPVSPSGEDRAGYMARFEHRLDRQWSALSADERQSVFEHVRDNDLVETVSTWLRLGLDAGFSATCEAFTADDDLYRMFRYTR